ncbi:hypothetical protein M8J75_004138 [Diaphorina citri]|nr:hypothetical protein M8J75_004138 [Diaphorina citri]
MLSRSLYFSAKICLNQTSTNLLLLKQADKQVFNLARHFTVKSSHSQASRVDKENKNDILIYEGPLASRIRLAKLFSLSSSMIGISLQPILYQKTLEAGTGLAVTIGGAIFLGFFTFVTPVLLHLVSRKYVSHLFYNPNTDEFTASTYNIFLVPKLTIFKAIDVTRPDLPTMFASFYVRGKPLFVDPENFTDIELYKKMMGYDKPVDLKLSKPELNKPANFK